MSRPRSEILGNSGSSPSRDKDLSANYDVLNVLITKTTVYFKSYMPLYRRKLNCLGLQTKTLEFFLVSDATRTASGAPQQPSENVNRCRRGGKATRARKMKKAES